MLANISLFEKRVFCNVLGCDRMATFKWFYQHDPTQKLIRVANSTNIIGWLGAGTYFCEIECGDLFVKVSNTFNSNTQSDTTFSENTVQMPPTAHIERILSNTQEWDFSKIPKTETGKIRELVKGEKWKDLAIIHNTYNVSSNSYCCNMEGVKTNFKAYVEMLAGGG